MANLEESFMEERIKKIEETLEQVKKNIEDLQKTIADLTEISDEEIDNMMG